MFWKQETVEHSSSQQTTSSVETCGISLTVQGNRLHCLHLFQSFFFSWSLKWDVQPETSCGKVVTFTFLCPLCIHGRCFFKDVGDFSLRLKKLPRERRIIPRKWVWNHIISPYVWWLIRDSHITLMIPGAVNSNQHGGAADNLFVWAIVLSQVIHAHVLPVITPEHATVAC